MYIERCFLLSALLLGCSTGPIGRTDPIATSGGQARQSYDTGAYASTAVAGRSGAPGQAGPAMQYTRPVGQARVEADRAITRDVSAAVLDDDALSNVRDLVITTHEGVVTILGTVATPGDVARVNAAASAVPGVSRVDNRLRVRD